MTMRNEMPQYMKYFDDLLEDQPVGQLPQDLRTCGECGRTHETCHMLIAGKKGRKAGISTVVIIQCSECSSVHLTQLFTKEGAARGLDASILQEIGKDLGMGPPKRRRYGIGP